ncbi:class I SAM-dependent methyltransferase [Paraburkholderia sp.]|uniref:class I SAM-dependent methyltransferase n=1 Tax=Paraburkholderia sp. TaxID=1926495 RepID=UPI002F41D84E
MSTTSDTTFSGSIPEIYDRLLVPLIFEPYARDLAERVAKLKPQAVLEIAAGTGVVTRELAARLPAGTWQVATDLNQPMLDYARAKQPKDGRIEWRQADALDLPFDDKAFDVVLCQFGAMFFPDKVRAYREARRLLKPGGHFVFNVWDRISENDFAGTITEALAARFPSDPPRFLARTPHGYYDVAQLRADLNAAGFTEVVTEEVGATSRASSARVPAVAYCQGTPLRAEIEARDPAGLEAATDDAAEALAQSFGHAAVEGRIRAIVITAAG